MVEQTERPVLYISSGCTRGISRGICCCRAFCRRAFPSRESRVSLDRKEKCLLQIPDIFPLTLFHFKVVFFPKKFINCGENKQKVCPLYNFFFWLEIEEAQNELGDRQRGGSSCLSFHRSKLHLLCFLLNIWTQFTQNLCKKKTIHHKIARNLWQSWLEKQSNKK